MSQKKVLMKGNEALAEGALIAGCQGFFGYPITPSSEIAEYMARKMPKIPGCLFFQAESELAAINMVYGTSAIGKRVMTASSGPGISLKQEGISFCAEGELPCLVVNISRGGPGLGGIQPSQADYFQATRGGGHGDYRIPVLAPASVQEMMDFAILSFELADKYRTPVMIMGEGTLGQMMEPIIIRDKVTEFVDKPWALTGCAGREPNIMNTLVLPQDRLEERNRMRQAKFDIMEQNEKRWETFMTEDAELLVMAYGLLGRVARRSVSVAREQGYKVGLIRPISLWPFPDIAVQETLGTVKHILSLEISMGQMIEDIRLAVAGKVPVSLYSRIGFVPNPEEITDAIIETAQREGL
ncbi:MAG: 3-methyl-2-oxobutanoate dehydrogenase subunit VorB [Syntrophomonadaceae bacterium]|nr:3-methyl-2-oxobutanoate dehydrogenase subunit VorB [Syntrophomonadaceae bacterium]